MKKTLKRILALVLVVCAILPYAVPAANAAAKEVTYDFNQLTYYTNIPSVSGKSNPLISMLQGYELSNGTVKTSMTQRYLNGDQNWTYEAASAGLCGSASNDEHLPTASSTRMISTYNGLRISMGKDQFNWIAFRIKSPGAGTFTMNFDFYSYAGSPTIAFYILEAEGEASLDHDTVLARQERIHTEIDPSNRIGKVDQSAGVNGSKNNTAYIGSHTFEADKEYILVAETYELASVPEWYACFSSVTFTKNGKEGTQLKGEPEVSSIQVLQNAVPASDGGYMGTVWEVKGHDYFFLPLEGSRMAIYDLDKLAAGEEPLVMMVNTGLYYPTHATVTDDGKVIVGGDGRRMFIFDTATMTGRNTPDFRSAEGLEGEGHNSSSFYNAEDGLIYFGTTYGGHMARYNMQTRTYEDLGGMACREVQEMALGKKLADDLVDNTGSLKAIACCGGFAYGLVNSDHYHIIVKYDLTAKKVVGALNVTEQISGGSHNWGLTVLGDRYVIAGASGVSGMVLVDLAKFSLVGIDDVVRKGLFTRKTGRAEDAWLNGMTGHATEVVNGKQFFFINSTGMYSYEVATGKMAYVGSGTSSFKTGAKTLVTLDRNKDGVEEEYLFTYAGGGQPRLFKPTAGDKISMNGLQADMNETGGSAINIGDSYDDVLYIGAWNNWNCVAYDTGAEAVKSRYVTGGQTDSQVSYVDEDGFHLVSGNYSACVVYEIDPDNKTGYGGDTDSNILMPLISGMKQYEQKRIHTVTGGGGYVFAGTIPDSYKTGGGVGVYNRATGTEDFIRFKETSVNGEKVIPNSELWDLAVQCIEYYDGRLFGTTTRSGGTGADKVPGTSAQIFVLDYENMTIEATLDLRDYLTLVDADKDGVEDPVDYVSSICVDEKGRFWGLCSDVLFCFTYNKETKTFQVQEVLNLGHSEYSTSAGAAWKSHKVVFDPANSQLFVSFYNYGMQQVKLINWNAKVGKIYVTNKQILGGTQPTYALGANNNLYYVSGADLYMRPVNVSGSDPAWTAAKSVDKMIEALGHITADKADEVAAVKAAYNALSLREKALVQELLTLQEAEVQVLRQQVDEISARVTAEDYETLDELYWAYMNMTDRQKRYIKNSGLLEETIFKAAMFKQSDALNQLQKDIYALEVNTLADTDKVLDARMGYDALPDDQQSVVNIDKLTAAEEKLDTLRKASGEDIDSGSCGEGLTWVLNSEGRLTISGAGSIESYPAGSAPWQRNRIFIRELVLDRGITAVGDYAFSGLSNLQTVYYGGKVAQKDSLPLGNGNNGILSAQWHYGYTRIVLGSQTVHYCSCCNKYYFPDSPMDIFADISNTGWQITHAIYACQKGFMAGKGTDAFGRVKFDPNSPITREEFVQVLYNAEAKPAVSSTKEFPDVAAGGWYKNAVLWAFENNIASGLGNGNFGVGRNITRQDLALMLYKYGALKGLDLTAEAGKINQFGDGSKVSDYATTAMDWAVTKGVLSGKGKAGADISTFRLDPAGTATRAECAAMLKNFMIAYRLNADNLPICAHTDMQETEAKEATCIEAGNIAYWYCDDCGRYFSDPEWEIQILPEDTVLEMVDHSWLDATCTAPKTCDVCGLTEGEVLPHSLSFKETVAPTCSEQGYDLHKCANCDYTEKENFVPVTDHNYTTMDLPTAATIAVEADPLGPNAFNYAKYALADYCDYDTQICTDCNHIDLAATCFRYSQLEAAQMMLQWVNDLRAEFFGTHAYDLVLGDFLQRTAESRASELVDDYSHNGASTAENAVCCLGLYAQFVAWKNSPGHYANMVNREFEYFGYGYADSGEDVPSTAYGCMTFS